MSNLFIITTPFQLLCSYEAINKLELKNNILVLPEINSSDNINQINKILNKELFSEVIYFSNKKKSKLFQSYAIIKKLKKINFNYLFLGVLGSIHKIFASNIKTTNIYLLDDGVATLHSYDKLRNNLPIYEKSLRQIRYKILGLKTSTSKNINIFTMFDNISSTKNIDVIHHDFEYLKKEQIVNKPFSKDIYILGENLIECNIISKEEYLIFLNYIINLYPNHKIKYLLHRFQKKDHLSSLEDKLEFIENELPGELYFLNLESTPSKIISSFTTLLFTLNNIYSDTEIISFRLNYEKKYDKVFSYLNEIGINTIDFKDIK